MQISAVKDIQKSKNLFKINVYTFLFTFNYKIILRIIYLIGIKSEIFLFLNLILLKAIIG